MCASKTYRLEAALCPGRPKVHFFRRLSEVRYILIVRVLRSLTKSSKAVIVQLRQWVYWRRSNRASFFEDREGLPVHTLCVNRFAVVMENEDFFTIKFVYVSGG